MHRYCKAQLIGVLVFFSFISIRCEKTEECIHAEACIVNNSETHTKTFFWPLEGDTITLEPKEGICLPNGYFKKLGTFEGGSESRVYASYFCLDGNAKSINYPMESCFEVIDCACTGIYKTEYCNNNAFDPIAGEQDIDCGGFCEPCSNLVDRCSLVPDSISIPDIMGESATVDDVTGRKSAFSDGGYEVSFSFKPQGVFLGNTRTSYLRANFYTNSFTSESRIFVTGSGEQELSLRYERGVSSPDYPDWVAEKGQTVVLVKEKNNWKLNLCAIRFIDLNDRYNGSATVSGQLLFDQELVTE